MTFSNMKSVAEAITYYAENPKYCPEHKLELLPSVNRYTDNPESKFEQVKFMRLVCPKPNCNYFDKALTEWFATITKKPQQSCEGCAIW